MSLLDTLLPKCDIIIDRDTHGAVVPLAKRVGCMIHYDASTSDAGGVSWFRSPQFKLSYNRAYTDNGQRLRITPSMHHGAYHAGVCMVEPGVPTGLLNGTFKYGIANQAYFGLAITADGNDKITREQLASLSEDIAVIFRLAAWKPEDVNSRIVGHNDKAIFNPRDNPTKKHLWGKRGRKSDPVGDDPSNPVIDMDELRQAVVTYLESDTDPLWANWP